MSLATTTLVGTVGSSDLTVQLADASAITAIGMWLFLDGEAMKVTALPRPDGSTLVSRGTGGSRALPHAASVTVYIGQATQFYQQNPEGEPPTVPFVLPWINVVTGAIWQVVNNAWVPTGGAGGGPVSGPSSATSGDLPAFGDATGTALVDSGVLAASVVVGPASVAANKVALFSGTTGKLLKADAAGVSAGPFTTITSITVVNGLITALTGS
jgi:hypothetical protein